MLMLNAYLLARPVFLIRTKQKILIFCNERRFSLAVISLQKYNQNNSLLDNNKGLYLENNGSYEVKRLNPADETTVKSIFSLVQDCASRSDNVGTTEYPRIEYLKHLIKFSDTFLFYKTNSETKSSNFITKTFVRGQNVEELIERDQDNNNTLEQYNCVSKLPTNSNCNSTTSTNEAGEKLRNGTVRVEIDIEREIGNCSASILHQSTHHQDSSHFKRNHTGIVSTSDGSQDLQTNDSRNLTAVLVIEPKSDGHSRSVTPRNAHHVYFTQGDLTPQERRGLVRFALQATRVVDRGYTACTASVFYTCMDWVEALRSEGFDIVGCVHKAGKLNNMKHYCGGKGCCCLPPNFKLNLHDTLRHSLITSRCAGIRLRPIGLRDAGLYNYSRDLEKYLRRLHELLGLDLLDSLDVQPDFGTICRRADAIAESLEDIDRSAESHSTRVVPYLPVDYVMKTGAHVTIRSLRKDEYNKAYELFNKKGYGWDEFPTMKLFEKVIIDHGYCFVIEMKNPQQTSQKRANDSEFSAQRLNLNLSMASNHCNETVTNLNDIKTKNNMSSKMKSSTDQSSTDHYNTDLSSRNLSSTDLSSTDLSSTDQWICACVIIDSGYSRCAELPEGEQQQQLCDMLYVSGGAEFDGKRIGSEVVREIMYRIAVDIGYTAVHVDAPISNLSSLGITLRPDGGVVTGVTPNSLYLIDRGWTDLLLSYVPLEHVTGFKKFLQERTLIKNCDMEH